MGGVATVCCLTMGMRREVVYKDPDYRKWLGMDYEK
jgi:hypothetical protein